MKIKRFVAPDMRTAFRLVREEHGPDAVILSNRRTDEGVEIVAASNYDEELVMRALDNARAEQKATAAIVPARATAPQVQAEPAPAIAQAAAAPARRTPSPADALIAAMAERQPARATATTSASTSTGQRAVFPVPPMPALEQAAAGGIPEEIFATFAQAAAPRAAAPAVAAPAIATQADEQPTPAKRRAEAAADNDFDLGTTLPRIAMPAPLAPEVPVAPAAPALAAVPATPAPQSDEQLAQLRDELALMRQMIEREMNRLTDERLRGSPVRAQALELLDDYGFDNGLTRDIALQIPPETELPRGRGLMLGLLSKRLPIAPIDPLQTGGVIALVGPTGAGKTTTIAKLASRFAAEHAPRDVALVTTDTQRVGGREQLYSYGRQLGIAVHEADSDQGLIELLERLADYKLVLIDTAGMGQRDRALAAQLNWLRGARQVTSLLVLPANAHFADLDEVVRRFAAARPQGVVLTKLDETGRFGSALSVVVDHQLPITWVTDGQRVPDDLHRANAASLVLRLEDLRRAADKPCTPEQNHAVA
ncbi:flagellar biosynthesis protein FlhF [Stenotrophomonas panacihumi]|uniref:Flagellar biosynthesis protein FlhF n=1 Tax=Stenotrophomonas panacihumi TaxID=676599 RepID=A0A0R0ALV6_9GAMM|nr:flagellar biosynthesis protein FlhF [Stenotrophomonas panacihumi]KRG41656.1 flagellar biosynthesis protein FlhF [Stenotrophomonas panacihumi]PTN53662.1 flagellar biosynthesis protein FlhF [Stenotrophomonas panacihumi]